jgi:hypothetical protein
MRGGMTSNKVATLSQLSDLSSAQKTRRIDEVGRDEKVASPIMAFKQVRNDSVTAYSSILPAAPSKASAASRFHLQSLEGAAQIRHFRSYIGQRPKAEIRWSRMRRNVRRRDTKWKPWAFYDPACRF